MAKRGKRAWEEAPEDEGEAEKERKLEEERERAQREKEEFAERLRLKDEEKTRKIMEAKVSKEEMEVRPVTWTLPSRRFLPLLPYWRVLAGMQGTGM